MDKEDATQEEVDSAKTALEEAQNGLKEKPVTPPDDPVITVDKTKLESSDSGSREAEGI